MFHLNLIWADEAPKGRTQDELYAVLVPALPPEGTVIQLCKKTDYGLFGGTVQFFDVEVAYPPNLDATDRENPAIYTVEVVPSK